jgi:hypothetical protein
MSQKLTQRAAMSAAVSTQDLMHLVDVSDTSQSPQGSSYKLNMQQLADFLKKAGIGNWTTVAPTVNDDVTQGYQNGSFWFDENAGKFYILNDNSAGAADWRPLNLQLAYDGGNVVNGATVTINGSLIAIGINALLGGSGIHVNAIGSGAAQSNNAAFVSAVGNNAASQNTGDYVNALGQNAASQNDGDNVNAFGQFAGANNTANHSNFFGASAGQGNTTSHGVTVFSPESVPSYADHAAAATALTVANGCVAGQVYIYRNEANDTIGFVIPA